MFPILFCEKSSTKIHEWRIWVEDSKIWRTDGQVGGKMKDPIAREISGNTLRSPEEQALLEAEKYWIKQVDKGYKPAEKDGKGMKIYNHVISQKSQNGGMNRGVKMFVETQITAGSTSGNKEMTEHHYPMLAKHYLEHLEKVKFPCYTQPKLDGVRAMGFISSVKLDIEILDSHSHSHSHSDSEYDKVILESRNGKDYVHLNHIREEIKILLKDYPKLVLDGELYTHNFENKKNVERFQFLSEACKITRTSPHPKESFVEYWIFDIWDTECSFPGRFAILQDLFNNYSGKILKLVPTKQVDSHQEIEKFMNKTLKQDFEGIMIRNSQAKYISRKDYHCDDLLKYKRFEDEEWVIVGADECQGTQKGAIKWNLELDSKRVVAKQMGSVEDAKELYKQFKKTPEKFIGEKINIRFNERTKDGIPRFPRATVIREDL